MTSRTLYQRQLWNLPTSTSTTAQVSCIAQIPFLPYLLATVYRFHNSLRRRHRTQLNLHLDLRIRGHL